MRVLVTGGAGFLGGYVLRRLREENKVYCLDYKTSGVYFCNLTDPEQTDTVFGGFKKTGVEAVVHLAALAGATGSGGTAESLKAPGLFFRNNINAALNVYEACRTFDIKKVVTISSFSVYGAAANPIDESTRLEPNNPYGGSKVAIEAIAKIYGRAYGIKSVIFRPTLLCGPGQVEENALREFVRCALQDKPLVILGEGNHVREWLHPADVAEAISKGLTEFNYIENPFEVFVLGTKPISMKSLAELVIKKVGRGTIEHRPANRYAYDQYTNHSKAQRWLGWEARTPVDEIVQQVIDDYDASRFKEKAAG